MYLSLIVLDISCILMSYFIAGYIYPTGLADRPNQWLTISVMIVPIYLLAAFGAHAYSVELIENVWRGVVRVVRSVVIAASAVVFIAFCLKSSAEMSRMIFAIGFASSIIALPAGRYYFGRGARAILGANPYSVALISDDENLLLSAEYSIAIPAASFDPESQNPHMYDRLASALRQADRVVVSCEPEKRAAWVHALQGANVQAEILAPELVALGPLMLARFNGEPTLVVARGPLSFPDRLIKRAFDIIVAGILLVLLAPALLLVTLAIWLEDFGSPFFVQTRIGRANRQFPVFKFRSMGAARGDANADTLTARDDERLTRVGKIIRAASIDELPQLINVLRGDMSLVGPRPHAVGARADEKLYWEVDRRYWHRHGIKPGMTGLAQIRGYRGATNLESDLINRLHADLEYLNRWSIWRDIKILFLTFGVVFHKNAF